MFYPSSISWKDNVVWCCDIKGDNCYESIIEKAELMQFTGLKDKNGKEIYEGDVVCVITGTGSAAAGLGRFHVEWWNKFGGFFLSPQTTHLFTDNYVLHYEVIGNIYENPELLKK